MTGSGVPTCAIFALLVAGCLSAAEPVGWARDRSGSFPDANPPFDFDGASGRHIAWKALMPNWSNGGVIVDAGRVFTMAEPTDSYRPTLTCLDADSGELLWRRELDAASCLPPGEREEARRFAEETWTWWRRLEALWSEAYFLHREHREQFAGWGQPPAAIAERWKAIGEEVVALGAQWDPEAFKSGAGGVRAPFRLARRSEGEARVARLADLCLSWDIAWRGFGTWCGIAFPTPVSHDGRVYTMTAHNHYACFDHDGELIWQRRFPRPSDRTVGPEHRDRIGERWRPAWPGQPCFPSSPILADGVLLSSTGYMLRGLDAATGEELWAKPYARHLGQGMATPAVVRIDGVALMIAVGHETSRGVEGPPGDEIVRVRDGKTVAYLPGAASGKGPGTGPIVVGEDLVVTRRHIAKHKRVAAAYRLRWESRPDRLVCEPVWEHDAQADEALPRDFILFRRGPWHDGLAYAGTAVFDLRTGEVVADHDRKWRVNQGYTGQGGCVTGPAYCRWDFYGDTKIHPDRRRSRMTGDATFHFFDRATGERLGTGRLPVHPADGLPQERQQAEEHRHETWRWLGAGTPFAVGGRLYVRSYDFVWCIGR